MKEDIRKEAEKFLNKLKIESNKPKNIYDFNTVVPNYILLPLKNLTEELIEKNKEQEKIIELMAKDIEKITGSCPFDLHNYQVEDCDNICQMLADNGQQYTCFIEYYEKKAKGE